MNNERMLRIIVVCIIGLLIACVVFAEGEGEGEGEIEIERGGKFHNAKVLKNAIEERTSQSMNGIKNRISPESWNLALLDVFRTKAAHFVKILQKVCTQKEIDNIDAALIPQMSAEQKLEVIKAATAALKYTGLDTTKSIDEQIEALEAEGEGEGEGEGQ